MNRGFVILAQNTVKTDYISCAKALATSIRRCMPDESITLITDNSVDDDGLFNKIVNLPYGDLSPDSDWKLLNDWQVYESSPYEYTIKLEADIFIPQPISYWWDTLSNRDLVISSKIRNFKGEISNIRSYRRFIDQNNLPDCYNSITYFKKSTTAHDFFKIVRDIFENWENYKKIIKCDVSEQVTTDWAYAIASHILGVENTLLPNFDSMSMVHMKQFINNLYSEDWTDSLVYELLPDTIRINTFNQTYPFHYYQKSFAKKLLETYQWKKK